MYKRAILLLFFTTLLSSTFGWCIFGGGKHMFLNKQPKGAGETWKVTSDNTCINLISNSDPFVSGYSGGPAYSCTLWSGTNCGGNSMSVSNTLQEFWSDGAWSLKCPC